MIQDSTFENVKSPNAVVMTIDGNVLKLERSKFVNTSQVSLMNSGQMDLFDITVENCFDKIFELKQDGTIGGSNVIIERSYDLYNTIEGNIFGMIHPKSFFFISILAQF
jgi:hypothetical protein